MAAVNTVQPLSLPTPQMPLTDNGLIVSSVWFRFFQGLFNRSAATIPWLVGSGLTATGTIQADALALSAEWNEVDTTPANSGVLLNNFGVGFNSQIFNAGANTLKVYPPTGMAIDALGANNPYSLATTKSQNFYQLTSTQIRSQQLG